MRERLHSANVKPVPLCYTSRTLEDSVEREQECPHLTRGKPAAHLVRIGRVTRVRVTSVRVRVSLGRGLRRTSPNPNRDERAVAKG